MDCSVLFLILFFLILIIFMAIQNETNDLDEQEQENQDMENYEKLPPLNYFTLDEPPYFFYDPVIVKTYENGKPVTTTKLQDGSLFGEHNYLRYYPPKPKTIPGN